MFSVAPRTKAPVVREHVDDEGELQRTVEFARWGFKPAWAKDKGPRPINARFETAHTNGMFRAGFASSRAVVPMTGYYEWVEMDDSKQPYYVHDRMPAFLDDELIAEWLVPGKLEKDEREHLHGALGNVSETVAASLVTHPVDRAVNNVRALDRSDSGLIAPIELS